MKGKWLVALLVLVLSVSVFAQIDLMGKVLDRDNKPVANVIATLSVAGVSDTTGSDGVYHLTVTAIKNFQGRDFRSKLNGTNLELSLTASQTVKIDILNMKGQQVVNVLNKYLGSGRYSIIPSIPDIAVQICIVRLQVGKSTFTYKYPNIGNKVNGATKITQIAIGNSVVASVRGTGDTLTLVKDEQVITETPILDLVDTLPDLFIVQRNFSGDLQSYGGTINKIEAVITGGNIPVGSPKLVTLYRYGNNLKYSGYVYFLNSLVSVNYNIYVKIYDVDNRFIGRSVNVPFISLAGDIEIPIFNIENAKPVVSLGPDVTVSINDTVHLSAIVVDSFSTLKVRSGLKWEWDIGGSGFIETSSGDTAIVIPTVTTSSRKRSLEEIIVTVKVTDIDGNVAMDTMSIAVVQDIPVPKAKVLDTVFVWQGEHLSLGGTATDKYGKIVKWEWDTGGAFVETTPDSNLSVVVDTYGSYQYILRVTDDDGNVATDTLRMNVLGINGKMSLIPSKNRSFLIGQFGTFRVRFTYNFLMDTTEITQNEYESVMGVNPSYLKRPYYPVEMVSWNRAVLYCNAKSKLDGFDTVYTYTSIDIVNSNGQDTLANLLFDISKKGYRLPTEAEWEYACGVVADSNSRVGAFWGNDTAIKYMWRPCDSTHAVGLKLPNIYKLYDMIGNVSEFTNNAWEQSYTSVNYGVDPIGPLPNVITGYQGKAVRGSNFKGQPYLIDGPIFRALIVSPASYQAVGFRTVRTVD